jgi:hypothetical protein
MINLPPQILDKCGNYILNVNLVRIKPDIPPELYYKMHTYILGSAMRGYNWDLKPEEDKNAWS